jgi:hypothetical protein
MLNVQDAMIFQDGSWALLPSWHASVDVSSSNICDENREKRNNARSILRMNTMDLDRFRSSRKVIVLRLILLYYAIKFDAPNKLWITTYIVRRTAL